MMRTVLMISKSHSKANGAIDIICKLRILWVLLPVLFIGTISNVSLVGASNDEDVSCYDRGYIDGEDHPFNQRTYDRCGDDYYQGFLQGCMSVEGNTRDTCESATDA
jgi:hypothetical protein